MEQHACIAVVDANYYCLTNGLVPPFDHGVVVVVAYTLVGSAVVSIAASAASAAICYCLLLHHNYCHPNNTPPWPKEWMSWPHGVSSRHD